MSKIYELIGATKEELKQLASRIPENYITYQIKKPRSNARRTICAPEPRLKEIQTSIVKNVLYKFKTHRIAHGFVHERDPKTNALEHLGCKLLIKLDLKDFFESIGKDKVITLFQILLKKIAEDITLEDIKILAEICTLKNSLPQGAPTSPAISNLYVASMDTNIYALATARFYKVTRYADDITFSYHNVPIPKRKAVLDLINQVNTIVEAYDLVINRKKTKIRTSAGRLAVTGVVVNSKLNLARKEYKIIRARVHNYHTRKDELDEHGIQVLRGKLEWLNSINPKKAKPLIQKLYSKRLPKPCNTPETTRV